MVQRGRTYPRIAALAAVLVAVLAVLALLGLQPGGQAGSRAQVASSEQAGSDAPVSTQEGTESPTSTQAASGAPTQAPSDGSAPSEASAQIPAGDSAQDGDGLLHVRFLDVGQGDCALVSCDGHHLLIDGGPPQASSRVFTVLRNLGVDRLDAVVATHPDADHIGGIAAAVNAADCDVCYCSTADSDTATFSALARQLDGKGLGITVPTIPSTFDLGSASVELIGPVRSYSSDNDNSIVCRVVYGQTAFLFMGDAEREAERELAASGANLQADVLKVGHHGSASSTTPELLDAVNPGCAVISVGAGNDMGHPTPQVTNRLDAYGIEVFRTDQGGDIVAVSDGQGVSIAAAKPQVRSAAAVGSQSTGRQDEAANEAAQTDQAAQGQPVDSAPIIGNQRSKVFHNRDCESVAKMSEKNKVGFASRDEAERAGLRPCSNCKP